jgi:hypothetical protein
MSSTAKLRAELERLKLQVAALTQVPRSVVRVIEPDPMPEDSASVLIRRRFVEPCGDVVRLEQDKNG